MEILHPEYFLALLLLWPGLYYLTFMRASEARVKFSDVSFAQRSSSARWLMWKRIHFIVKALVIFMIILALSRVRWGIHEAEVKKEGIDLVLAIDISGSMLAEDFTVGNKRANRLAVVKNVVKEFIGKRPDDRIGVVIFAGRPYTLCPLTLDHELVLEFLERAQIGLIEDGTAIGSGIATSIRRLKGGTAKSKVIVLLTDGVNNAGSIDPVPAAELANKAKIKIYTVGAGSSDRVPFPAQDPWGRTVYQMVKIEMNEQILRNIADKTGGKYYRATNTDELRDVYRQIDSLEKTVITENKYSEYRELYLWPLGLGIFLFLLDVSLRFTRLRTIP